MQSFSHLRAFGWVQALKSLLLVGGKYKGVGAYLSPRSKSSPLASSASFCQIAETGGLCASYLCSPLSLLPPMMLLSNYVPVSHPTGEPGQTLWPLLSWKALYWQLLPSLWSSQLSSLVDPSVDWPLLLTGVCGAYSHCHDLRTLSPHSARICWGKNWVIFQIIFFPSCSIPPCILCPAACPSPCSITNPWQKKAPSHK